MKKWISEPGKNGTFIIYDEETGGQVATVYGSRLEARMMASAPWFLEQLRELALGSGQLDLEKLRAVVANFEEKK